MWVSCCRGRASACPKIRVVDDKLVEIKDDYGYIVRMTVEQLKMVIDTVKKVLVDDNSLINIK